MKQIRFAGLALRLRLSLLRAGPVMLGMVAVLLLSAAAAAWLLHALVQQEHEREALQARAAQVAQAAKKAKAGAGAAVEAPPPVLLDNLDTFYATLGQRRYA